MSLKSIVGSSVVSLGLLACGGDLGSDTRAAPPPEAPSSTPPTVFSQADVEAASAQCAAAHGDVETYATVDKLVGMLAHTWLHCADRESTPSGIYDAGFGANRSARVGVELTADGHFYWLSRNEAGVVVRGQGLTEIAGYEITPPSDAKVNNVSFQIDVIYPSGSIMGTRATFEADPRRLALQGVDGMFVPLTAK